MRQRGWRLGVKRGVDVAVAGAAFCATAPVMAAAAIAIVTTMGRPVLFQQDRVGRDGRIFSILKFRTMLPAPEDAPIEHDAVRITRLGKFLRDSSIDELPQLLNILRGDMSLVGPRPLLVRYMPRYDARQRRRHEVLPGLTGWAQVRGRNAMDWADKLEHDVWYVENWSLRLDARILLSTAVTVLRRDGISAAGHPSMPEFMGTEAAA